MNLRTPLKWVLLAPVAKKIIIEELILEPR
jgi:hypothetical protein